MISPPTNILPERVNRSRPSACRDPYVGALEGAAQRHLDLLHGALSAFIAASTYYNADQGVKTPSPKHSYATAVVLLW